MESNWKIYTKSAISIFYLQCQPPARLANACRNRHDFTSLNVMIVADAEYKILDIRSEAPGSMHDTKVFQVCDLSFY